MSASPPTRRRVQFMGRAYMFGTPRPEMGQRESNAAPFLAGLGPSIWSGPQPPNS